MADIILRSISHSYVADPGPDDYVIRDLNLHWQRGGAYALLGPSGCGKTTLLNLISGLIRPTKGQVAYVDEKGERDVTDFSPRQRNIAQVFQFPVIYDTMTVYQNLAFPLRNRGMNKRDIDRRVREIAEMLDLTSVLKRRAIQLGLDTKQIISLGRGLVRDDVAAILFDEPLTVIDPHRKWVLRRKLREIHRSFEHTLIYVTHDQTEALTFADEVVVMHEGEVLQQGSPEALFTDPAHTYVGYFIGSPGMNFFPCQLEGNHALVAGQRVPVPSGLAERAGGHDLGDTSASAATSDTSGFKLGIRPEHVRLHAGSAGVSGSRDSSVPGITVAVRAVEDHGHMCIVSGTVGTHPIKLKLSQPPPAQSGESLAVILPSEHVRLYRNDRIIA